MSISGHRSRCVITLDNRSIRSHRPIRTSINPINDPVIKEGGTIEMSLINKFWDMKHCQVGIFLLVILLACAATTARAQLQVPLVRGDIGLQGGSQPPPGVYLTGLLYFYDTHTIVDQNGIHRKRVGLSQWFGGLDLMYVSKKKILGGNYSAQVVLPITNVA